MKTSRLAQILKYTVLVVGMLLIAAPMYLTVTIAMKTPAEMTTSFFSLPSSFYLGNFEQVINKGKFWLFLGNSTYITIASIAVMLILIPMLSYAISRNAQRPYFKFVYVFILAGIFIPFQAIMLPVYKHMSSLNLLNQPGLIIMYVTFSFTQGMFLCVGFLKNVPLELDDASKIDGCGVWQTFTRIVYPLMIPILVTILILNSLWLWNDFMLPLIMLNRTSDFWTLPLFIYNFKSEYSFDYNLAFAGFFMTMLPILILYGFAQKYIIGGLTEGALK